MNPRRNLWFLVLLVGLHAYIGLRVLPWLPDNMVIRLGTVLLLASSCGLMLFSLVARSFWPRPLAAALFPSASKLRTFESFSADLVVGLGLFATLAGLVGARRRARVVDVD